MTDQVENEAATPLETQKMIIIALVVIAALLAAIVGVMVYKANKDSALPVAAAPAAGAAQGGAAAAPAGMGQSSGAAAVPFDAKTATKVPKGTEPEAYVKQYYELCQKGDYAKAFPMLPKDKQASYGDAKAFEAQVAAYGISGFELEKATVEGDNASVTAWQKTANGSFGYTWVLVKGDDGSWLVKSRDMAGMK